MEFEKTKRKGAKCWICRLPINSKYRVKYCSSYSHLSCLYEYLMREFNQRKEELRQFNKAKYKKQMVVERLR